MNKLLILLGLAMTEKERKMKEMVDKSYESLRVVGRGTVKIDSSEVRNSKDFQVDCDKAKQFFKNAV